MIRTTTIDDVLHITLDRPRAANALTEEMLGGLLAVVTALPSTGAHAVVLRGAPPIDGRGPAFCSGADLAAVHAYGTDAVARGSALGDLGRQVTAALDAAPVPVVAAVDGAAYGGGFELVLACDVVLATGRSRFALPEVRIGLVPGFGGTVRLPRAVGRGVAHDMMLTGRALDAAEAARHGVVTRLVADTADLEGAVDDVLCAVRGTSPAAVSLAKQLLGAQAGEASAMAAEADGYAAAYAAGQWREGVGAFLAKRPADYGRRDEPPAASIVSGDDASLARAR
ncbi:enoyl-CoA hydratase/isomerase family protein [Isoptericola croceus]|uniref:enoyl-CoA hydratase/isomerase family protein n=1 Tax=Isoptericola croceus TaxID=3031406 RepID=UPI0023F85C59|nr:enoyl-CoA hydratase/isomerase family protein [Isoptericola croceus]